MKFQKGMTPWNKGKSCPHSKIQAQKTGFKKGHKPHSHRPLGACRVDRDGYIRVKIAEPNQWRLKHIVEFERHFGDLPKGYCVRFKDGDKTNFAKDNLVAIPRGANMILNSRQAGLGHLPISEPIISLAHLRYLMGKKHG